MSSPKKRTPKNRIKARGKEKKNGFLEKRKRDYRRVCRENRLFLRGREKGEKSLTTGFARNQNFWGKRGKEGKNSAINLKHPKD